MSRKQLGALFVGTLIPYFTGSALVSLLPIYSQTLGADTSSAGLYLGLIFGALAVSTLLSGTLSDHFQHRKQFIILSACLNFACVYLMGQTDDFRVLTLLTMVVWFCGGITLSMLMILTGMYAPPAQRGRIFGVVVAAASVAQLIGGFVSGRIVDRWGYEALFTVVALSHIILLASAILLEDRQVERSPSASAATAPIPASVSWLTLASLLINTASFCIGLGLVLAMSDRKFDATTITTTSVIAGLALLPLPYVWGWLSDHVGRRELLAISYLGPVAAALVLANAGELWQFWLVAPVAGIASSSNSVAQALVTDLAAADTLGRSLGRFSAAAWIGGVFGYIGGGAVLERLGVQATFTVAALLPFIAILILMTQSKPPLPQQA